ncbi:hypothetical protein CFC21_059587 [Triticum aestivum]|uniref:Uncharacterized protein n=2 Tax=Triticum aestivum TaxID=4565 RepID=A0A9R1GQM1_WHEAT|nr:protein PAIR1-like isoform X1 [Triticum aestivum]KAF7051344.1 hypothetical protein CFC21_059587 [Triticum aestivum]
MKLKINKACDIASISVLPPRRTGGSSSGGGGMSAPAAASAAAAAAAQQQRSQSMSQKSFSQGGGGGSFSQGVGASFSQAIGSGGASFSQARGASFSQGSGSGGAAFSQGGGGGGAAFSQGVGGGGAAFSQGGGGGGAAFSQGGGNGVAAFSQGGGSGGASFSQGGGSAPLVHAQSQLSQASLDANLLSLLSQAPARDQRFALQQDSSKRTSSYPASSASCVREESQLQLTKIPTNPIHRWSPSLPDSRCQVNEEVERKFQHLASSVHKMGMILDSVQNDVMQLNRAMKEASLDSGSIQKKFALLEDSLKQILKEQDDLKAVVEEITESNPDQLSVLNSLASKQDEMSSLLSVLPNHVQGELGQLKADIFRTFSKEMEGMVRAVRSVDTRFDQMQMLANQTRVANGSPLMMQTPVAYGSPLMNQTTVADGGPLMNQGPVADGRPRKKQRPAANGRSQRKKLTPVANGRPQRKKQRPVANGRPQRNQRPVPNGRPQVKQAETADASPQMNQKPEANGEALMNRVVPVTQAVSASAPAPLVYHRKTEGVKPNVEKGMAKAATEARKLDGSGDSRPAPPKEQELAIQKDNEEAPINKATLTIVIDSDEEEGGVMLKAGAGGAGGAAAAEEAVGEVEALEILRRARKRRRREEASAAALDRC